MAVTELESRGTEHDIVIAMSSMARQGSSKPL